MAEEVEKVIHNEHELMTALTMFFAVFWNGDAKFKQIVIRSRENSLQQQTRVSIDFQDHKELWNMVIQDYLKNTGSRSEKDAFVREELRLLLGGMQKKRYEKLLEKMPTMGLEIEEDIVGAGRSYLAFEFQVSASEARPLSSYLLLEKDGKFFGKATLPNVPAEVSNVLEKLISTFQAEKALGRLQVEVVYIPKRAGQEERVIVLGTDLLEAGKPTLEESLQSVLGVTFDQGQLHLPAEDASESKIVAFLLDTDTQVTSEATAPYFLKDMKYSPEAGRGVVFYEEANRSVVPENSLLYVSSGTDANKAFENVLLLYEQSLSLQRDMKAREKLTSARSILSF